MIVELILDNQTIMELQEKNRKLRLENAQLRQKGTKEVIEIIDRRTPETDFSFPNTEGL
jgi:regulator of replication initiation timing